EDGEGRPHRRGLPQHVVTGLDGAVAAVLHVVLEDGGVRDHTLLGEELGDPGRGGALGDGDRHVVAGTARVHLLHDPEGRGRGGEGEHQQDREDHEAAAPTARLVHDDPLRWPAGRDGAPFGGWTPITV